MFLEIDVIFFALTMVHIYFMVHVLWTSQNVGTLAISMLTYINSKSKQKSQSLNNDKFQWGEQIVQDNAPKITTTICSVLICEQRSTEIVFRKQQSERFNRYWSTQDIENEKREFKSLSSFSAWSPSFYSVFFLVKKNPSNEMAISCWFSYFTNCYCITYFIWFVDLTMYLEFHDIFTNQNNTEKPL